jgi:hypothetical protein
MGWRGFGVGAAFLALGSCATPELGMRPELTFEHLEPVRFNAATLELVDDYRPPLSPPNVEHIFPISPAAAVRMWAQQRLSAEGQNGVLRVIIHKASVIAEPIEVRTGVIGLLFYDQNVRYNAEVDVTVEYIDPGTLQTSVRVLVTRSRTGHENLSLDQRDAIFYEMLEGVMEDLDSGLIAAVRENMLPSLLLP